MKMKKMFSFARASRKPESRDVRVTEATGELGQISCDFDVEKHRLLRVLFEQIRLSFSSTVNNGMRLDGIHGSREKIRELPSVYLNFLNSRLGRFEIRQIAANQMALIRSTVGETCDVPASLEKSMGHLPT